MLEVPSWQCHSSPSWPPGSPGSPRADSPGADSSAPGCATLRTRNEQLGRTGPSGRLRCGLEGRPADDADSAASNIQVERTVPYWEGDITPALKRGKTVLVAAHGNSIRGILKHIDGISDEEITGLEIPTGIPLVYHLDKDLKPIKSPRATVPVLSGYFLADQSDLEAAQKKVADQTQVADG
eukprot:scaffold36314_cov73-Phaeocystis_antarctica.AAC.5